MSDPSNNVTPITATTPLNPAISLDSLAKSVTHWRANKKNMQEPMPEEIWEKIFMLTKEFPSSILRATLGVTSAQFQRKLDEYSIKLSGQQKAAPLADLSFYEIPKPKISSAPLYQPAKALATNTLIVEFCRADGRMMKIHTTTDSFAELMRAFFEDK